MLYVLKDKQKSVRHALSSLIELNYEYEPHGSRIIFYNNY